jgi:hypothetical protein
VGSFFDSPEHLRAPTGADVLQGELTKVFVHLANEVLSYQFSKSN